MDGRRKLSFSSDIVEEIRSGCRNLQRSLIVMQYGLSELKSSLVCRFKNMSFSKISSTDVGNRVVVIAEM